jgi:hypothetical protein
MTVIFQTGYSLPASDEPLTHARILHSLNWLSGGTVTASSTATGFFAAGPANSLTYEKWKPSSLAATWEYDHGSAAVCDCCCIAAHTMGTNGNTLQVQYWNGSSWVDLITATAISDDGPIYVIFGQQTRQRWRVRITNGTAPTIGAIKFGLSMQMERPIFGGHAPINTARQYEYRTNYSETGEFLGRSLQRSFGATEYAWSHLTTTWVRNYWRNFQTATKEPFWIAWRPGDNNDVAYGVTDELPVPSNMGIRGLMQVSMSVRARGFD